MPYIFETLSVETADGIALVRINRPEQRNMFNSQMMADLIALIDQTDSDDDVRCVVITGAGKYFCAGAELSGAGTFDRTNGAVDPLRESGKVGDIYRDRGGRVTMRLFNSLKPVIGAINGPSAGVGATMPLAMDIRLASTEARFGFVFVKRGIVPEAASAWFLPRLVGVQRALEWCFRGKMVDAEEALASGLVRSVHAPEDLLPAAMEIARDIASSTAPVSVALTRQMIWRMLGAPHPMDAHRADSRAVQYRGASADAREGIGSFLEKRNAVYPDRVSEGLPDIWTGQDAPEFS